MRFFLKDVHLVFGVAFLRQFFNILPLGVDRDLLSDKLLVFFFCDDQLRVILHLCTFGVFVVLLWQGFLNTSDWRQFFRHYLNKMRVKT